MVDVRRNPPPADPESEQATLGAILVKPEVLDRVAEILTPADFHWQAHSLVFQAMLDLARRGDAVDLVTVTNLLRERRQLDRVGGPDMRGEVFLAALSERVAFAVNAEHYAWIVAKRADLRRKRELALKIIEACDNSGDGLDGLISQISAPRRGPASFNPITAKKLGEMEFPPRRWVVPDLITEGLTLLAGRPKIGKGWLALNIAVAVATGGLAMGKIQVEIGEALYLSLEDSWRRMKERLEKTIPLSELPEGLHIETIGSLPRLNQGGLAILDAWLRKYPGVKLVIVDTLARVKPEKKRGDDSYQHDSGVVGDLQKLAFDHQVALILIHHTNKRQTEDIVEEVSGTYGLTGASDAVAVLSRKARGQMDGILKLTGRDIEEQELAMNFDPDLGLWNLLGETREVTRSKERQDILLLLKELGPMSAKQIAEHLSKNLNNIYVMLSRMKDAGEVKSEEGKYTVPK
jgi:hypothetical protein